MTATGQGSGPARWRPRSSILARLLTAFVVVSFLPIAVLAGLSLQELAADPGAHQEGGEAGETAEPGVGHGTLAGIPIEFVELGVAGVSLALSVAAALYVGRTISADAFTGEVDASRGDRRPRCGRGRQER